MFVNRFVKAVRRNSVWTKLLIFSGMIMLVVPAGFVSAQGPGQADIQQLIMDGQGDQALQVITDWAWQLGGWGPAPGDRIMFDPLLVDYKRATTVAIDQPPLDCNAGDRADGMHPDCGRDFSVQQDVIRFGLYTLVASGDESSPVMRDIDDILSVYIEEVGHSWQEYCYETEGRCAGERTRMTTWGEGNARANGWEYQIKRYILSLDGMLLSLSDGERYELMSAICGGYASPQFTIIDVPVPPNWPNPEGWPASLPTEQELAAFCQNA